MKKLLYTFIALFIGWQCQAQTKFTLSGKIQNFNKNQALTLYRLVYNDYTNRPELKEKIDFRVNSDGTFKQNHTLHHAGIFNLRYHTQSITLAIYPNDHLQVTLENRQFKVTGSEITQQIGLFYKKMATLDNTYLAVLRKKMQNEQMALHQALQKAKDETQKRQVKQQFTAKNQLLMAQLTQAGNHLFEAMNKHLQQMPPTLALYATLGFWKPHTIQYIQPQLNKLKQQMPDNPQVKQMLQKAIRLMKLTIGQAAPDISLINAQNQSIKLSETTSKAVHKYVLVDFWATWCAPCLIENKNLKEVYKKYKPLGFEIYGVSFDRDKTAWLNYLKKGQTPWIQVFESAGFKSSTSLNYNLREFPANFLLDSQGKVVGRNLFGDALKDKLAALLGK